jgi:hypothetical protein
MSELQRLYDRIFELEEALGMTAVDPGKMRRGGDVARRLLGLLIARPFVPYDAAYDVIYGCKPECDQPKSDTLKVVAHRVKCRLAQDGITMRMVWGVGWYLSSEDREKAANLYGTDAALAGTIWRQKKKEAA